MDSRNAWNANAVPFKNCSVSARLDSATRWIVKFTVARPELEILSAWLSLALKQESPSSGLVFESHQGGLGFSVSKCLERYGRRSKRNRGRGRFCTADSRSARHDFRITSRCDTRLFTNMNPHMPSPHARTHTVTNRPQCTCIIQESACIIQESNVRQRQRARASGQTQNTFSTGLASGEYCCGIRGSMVWRTARTDINNIGQ